MLAIKFETNDFFQKVSVSAGHTSRRHRTLVHLFDWSGGIAAPYEALLVDTRHQKKQHVRTLVRAQGVGRVLNMHELDVSKIVVPLSEQHVSSRFKLNMPLVREPYAH